MYLSSKNYITRRGLSPDWYLCWIAIYLSFTFYSLFSYKSSFLFVAYMCISILALFSKDLKSSSYIFEYNFYLCINGKSMHAFAKNILLKRVNISHTSLTYS